MKHPARMGRGPIFLMPAPRPRLSSRRFALALMFPLLLLIGVAAGCRSSEIPEEAAPSAENNSVSLELVVTIGCADCDDASAITPTVVALLDGGGVAVLDRYEPFVRIFDAAGDLGLTFGNKGQGPGELGTDTGGGTYFPGVHLLPWPDGSLSVVELIPAAIETFGPEGSFRGQHTPDLPFANPAAQAFSPATGGYFRFARVPVSNTPDMIQRCVIEPGVGSECGDFADPSIFLEDDDGQVSGRLALATTPLGNLVIANVETYRIWVLDDDGVVAATFDRDIPRPQKSDAELEAERAANEALQARGRPKREIDTNRDHIAAAGLQIDGAGHIWVLTERYGSTDSVFDVLDLDGNFLQEITVASMIRFNGYQLTPFVASGSRLAALALQADGSTRVDVYEIVER